MPKPCRVEGCLLPKALPAHRCYWHDVMAQPIDRQVSQAMTREAMVPEDCRLPRVPKRMWAPGSRWCAGCQSMPPLFYFSPQAAQCRACSSAARHAASIRKEYDLEPEEYAALLELQDGRCAICRHRPVSIRLAVDHDHRTGKVRGLCCVRCNHDVLGSAHDSLDIIERAAHYLRDPPTSGRWNPPSGPPKRQLAEAQQRILAAIPFELTAEDGYRLSGSRGDEVIYVLRSALQPPF